MKELVELKQDTQTWVSLCDSSVILFDLPKLNAQIADLEAEQNKEGFWSDQRSALVVVNKLKDAKSKVDTYTKIKRDFQDVQEMISWRRRIRVTKRCVL
jgi:hypothetical protein